MIERAIVRARAALAIALLSRVVRNTLIVLAVLVALDWVFRLPVGFRIVQGGTACVALAAFAVMGALRIVAFKPRPIDVALRIERSHPTLRNRLAALLEFEEQRPEDRTELLALGLPALRAEVNEAIRGLDPSTLTSMRSAMRPVRQLGLVVVLWAAALAALPSIIGVGIVRAVAPWSDAQWPSTTELAGPHRSFGRRHRHLVPMEGGIGPRGSITRTRQGRVQDQDRHVGFMAIRLARQVRRRDVRSPAGRA